MGRLVRARTKPGTMRSTTCSRRHSHCGSGQKDLLLLYPLPHAAAAPLQAREQHPRAAAPIPTKPSAVGYEMEVAEVWHRVTTHCREGVSHCPILAELALLRGATREAMLLHPRVALAVRVCMQRPAVASTPVPSSSPRAGSSSAPPWLHAPPASLGPCTASPCPVCPCRQGTAGPSAGPSRL